MVTFVKSYIYFQSVPWPCTSRSRLTEVMELLTGTGVLMVCAERHGAQCRELRLNCEPNTGNGERLNPNADR